MTPLKTPAGQLRHDLPKVLRRFGRQCRGQGTVCVKLVRQTATQLVAVGVSITQLVQQAQQNLPPATPLSAAKRERGARARRAATQAPQQIRPPSRWLTQGKRLSHSKIVNAYDPTMAPIMKGTSNGPAQCGRQPGSISEPPAGFICAARSPVGHPSAPSSVLPLLDSVQNAIQRLSGPKRLSIPALAGALGVHDPVLRQALHARGMRSIGIPKTIEPINPTPSPEEMLAVLKAAGLHRKRTPHQVQLACACGDSRPVVERHIACLLCRGAGQMRSKGPHGAVVQLRMTVMAHNGAALVRIRQQRLAKRAQKFRRLLGLRCCKVNQISNSKN